MPSKYLLCPRSNKLWWVAVFVGCLLFLHQISLAGEIESRDGVTIIHVTVTNLPDPSFTDTATRADVAAVKQFKKRFAEIFAKKYAAKYKANPEIYGNHNWDNVQVELHRFSGLRVENVETDLLAIAGDMAPDILYVNFRKSDNYIRNGFLYPLDQWVDDLPQEELQQRVHEKIWPVIKRKGLTDQTHIWAMPYGGALGKVLLFRKDLFDENNIPYPDENWTWEQLLDAAKILTKPAKDQYGLLLGRGMHESWRWITFLWSAGGEVMTYDEKTDKWSCEFNRKGAAKALDFYSKLSAEKWIDDNGMIRRGYSSKDASNAGTKWVEGKVGMDFSYIDEKLFSKINPDVTGMVPVPLGPPDENGHRMRGGELNSRMMGLFAKIKDPAVRDAAFEYIWYYDSNEAMEIKSRIMVEGGLGRFVNPKYLKRYGYHDIIRLTPPGWAKTFDIAVATGKPEPYGKNSNYAYQMMTVPIQQAEQMLISGQLSEDDDVRLGQLQALLDTAVEKANEKMLGILTPQQKKTRRLTAACVLVLIVIAFGFVFRKVIQAFTPPTASGEGKRVNWGFKKYWNAYLLLLPAVLTILIWHYVPLLRGSVMAFMDYKIMGNSEFTGLDNFGNVLFDVEWWQSVYNSLRYCFLVISLTFLPPIILAVLLQEVPRGKLVFRTIFYLPAVITGLVTLLLWKMFYAPSEFGALNRILMYIPAIAYVILGGAILGACLLFSKRLLYHGAKKPGIGFIIGGVIFCFAIISLASPILFPTGEHVGQWAIHFGPRLFKTLPEPYQWLSNSSTAMIACVIPMVWAGMGPGCLIYLAALKGIPDDFYEAADIDGAGFADKILFVVFPILKPLVIINFIGVFIGAWMSSANILAMTAGGANTEVAGLRIFYEAFTYLKMGPATAMAWLLGFMLIGFTVYQLRILSRLEFKTVDKK
ncbi:MAG: extracellular solute-binding protein [Phycisphaeraceae bacterium]|nr:extracellular solute-binding protein [Phycisphaeraceae bacterium]